MKLIRNAFSNIGRIAGAASVRFKIKHTDDGSTWRPSEVEERRITLAQVAFDEIYRNDLWALKSGEYSDEKPGLETEQARNARLAALIQDILRLNEIKSVVEFGCGYWSYASQVDWTGVQYDGYDIVEEVIKANCLGHNHPNVRFHVVRDGTRLPRADLLISKDVLQHLPTADVQHYMSLFIQNFSLLLICNDIFPADNLNGPIEYGAHRALRLDVPPFNIPTAVVQQWRCYEFGTFIIKNFCLIHGNPNGGDPAGIILDEGPTTSVAERRAPARDTVGLDDLIAGGWANFRTGELFSGFQVQPSDTVVDVGCGSGAFASFAARLGAAVTILDKDPATLAAAKVAVELDSPRQLTAIVSDCDPIPLPNATATKVICTEVLEHVADPNTLIREIARVAVPGAKFLFSVPHQFGENLQRLLAPGEYFEQPNHVRIFSRIDFENLVQSGGLVIDKWHADGFYWCLFSAMVWSCDPGDKPHRTLDAWAECWSTLLKTKDGLRVKSALDTAAPNKQTIVAHKPMT